MYYLIFTRFLSSTFLSNTYANLTILTDFIFCVILLSKETRCLPTWEECIMSSKKPKPVIEYRNYYLPSSFPVLLLTGDNWKISDVKSEHLHFHNCLEVGICHSRSGILEFCNSMTMPFSEGDVTCIPRNIPHTTYSAPCTKSRWSYLFFDPRQLFRDMLPPDFDYSMIYDDVHKYLIPAGFSRRIPLLAEAAVEELSVEDPDRMLVKSYLFALYMEIIRFQNPETHNIQSENTPPLAKSTIFWQ